MAPDHTHGGKELADMEDNTMADSSFSATIAFNSLRPTA
jgi:hypothetical protein